MTRKKQRHEPAPEHPFFTCVPLLFIKNTLIVRRHRQSAGRTIMKHRHETHHQLRTVAAAILLPAALCSCFSSPAEETVTGKSPDRGVFLYDLPPTAEAWEAELASLKAHGFSQISLSRSDAWVALADEEKASRLETAASEKISVSLMAYESTVFLDPAMLEEAASRVEELLAFNAAHPSAAYAGLTIDVEPHTLFTGDTGGNNALAKQFHAFLKEMGKRYDLDGSLSAGVCTGWWYSRKSEDGTYPELGLGTFRKNSSKLIPMVYDGIGSTAEDIIWRVDPDMKRIPVQIGVGAHEFTDWASLKSVLDELDVTYRNEPNYRGTIIFHSAILPSLPGY